MYDHTMLQPQVSCFNPRARDGRDLSSRYRPHRGTSFNPRARDGRDARHQPRDSPNRVSIHAPVMDAISLDELARLVASFNPRARDGRDIISLVYGLVAVFQSTRP